jgi:hypothetical protein
MLVVLSDQAWMKTGGGEQPLSKRRGNGSRSSRRRRQSVHRR